MKKFISVLLASFAICMLVSCDGAKSQDATNEKNYISSINVHSISYHAAGEYSTNLISGFKFDTIEEPASASDYENATDKFSVGSNRFALSGAFDINGTASTTCSLLNGKTLDELKELVGKTIYYHTTISYYKDEYYKVTITELFVNHINVTFLSDESLIISYFDYDMEETVTTRVKTDNYTVVFFTENK